MFETLAIAGTPVRVYWNIRKRCFSVQVAGHVVAHTDRLFLRDATFHVQAAGRNRVRRERRKNVHAFVDGTLVDPYTGDVDTRYPVRVKYNPYRDDSFMADQPGHWKSVPIRAAWGVACLPGASVRAAAITTDTREEPKLMKVRRGL